MMNCQRARELMDAYLDQELDLMTSSKVEHHLAECAGCSEVYAKYRQVRNGVSAQLKSFAAPPQLEAKIRAGLNLHQEQRSEEKAAANWRNWAVIAACLAGILVLSLLAVRTLRRPSASALLAQEVVSSHIRSLLANHLSDVVSTDQHTVKPWFSGKLDFAPLVKDLSADEFPLVGGRLDYLDNRPVAALIYKHRQHTINLFTWPSTGSDSGLRSYSLRGYHVLRWTRAKMTYWAVSDMSAADLDRFARDFMRGAKTGPCILTTCCALAVFRGVLQAASLHSRA
jgi:anti-sigma factor RsiW